MKSQVINWLKFDREFESGVHLFMKFGTSLSLKARLNRQGKTQYNMDLLMEELRKLAGIDPAEFKSIISIPVHVYGKRKAEQTKAIDPVISESAKVEQAQVIDPLQTDQEQSVPDTGKIEEEPKKKVPANKSGKTSKSSKKA